MGGSGFNSILALILVAYLLSGCARLSQGDLGGTPPDFQPLLGKWLRANPTNRFNDVIEVASVSASGDVDVTCYIVTKTLYLEDREYIGTAWKRSISVREARAKIEDGRIKFSVKFNDRKYDWSSFDLFLFGSSDLMGTGVWLGRTVGMGFSRQ